MEKTIVIENAGEKKFAVAKQLMEVLDLQWSEVLKLLENCPVELSLASSVNINNLVNNLKKRGAEVYNPNNMEHDQKQKETPLSPLEIFRRGVTKYRLTSYDNNNDCFILNIPDTKKRDFRRNFNIPLDETILMGRDTSFWNNANQGVVITDKNVYILLDNDSDDDIEILSWNRIESVKYQDAGIYFNIDGEPYGYGIGCFLKPSGNENNDLKSAQRLATIFESIAKSIETIQLDNIATEVGQLIEEKQFEEAKNISYQHINNTSDSVEQSLGYFWLGRIFSAESWDIQREIDLQDNVPDNLWQKRITCENEAQEAFDQALKLCDDDDEVKFLIYLNKGYVGDNPLLNRNYFIEAMQSNDYDIQHNARNGYDELTEVIVKKANNENEEQDDFCNTIEYRKRNLMFIVGNKKQIAGCYDKEELIPCVFTMDTFPQDINFPIGHPQANTLYLGHPLIPTEYIPFENATEKLFLDKIREFCYLVQCLGAEEIIIQRTKGSDISTDISNTINANVGGGRKLVEASLEGNASSKTAERTKKTDGVELIQQFHPSKYPFCPNDLIWLDSDSTWKSMIKQRLNGNLLNYSEKITSAETTNISSSQMQGIKGSMSNLLIKANASLDRSIESTFSKTEEKEIIIKIKFKPIDEFVKEESVVNNSQKSKNQSTKINDTLSEKELAFLEEVKFCLEDDGKIDDNEMAFLKRKRIKLGVSEERAQEIIAMCTTTFSEEEQEYIDVLIDVMIDGVIPEIMRRLLAREMKSLNITEERAKEIEEFVLKNHGKS